MSQQSSIEDLPYKSANAAPPSEEAPKFQYITKVILIGDSNTGKTSLINRFVSDKFEEKYNSTIGVDFMMKRIEIGNDTIVRLQIWDTAGMEKYKQLTTTYYRGAQGAFVVFDLTNSESFKSVDKWLEDFHIYANPEAHRFVYLIGNKSDLEDRKVSIEEINKFIDRNNIKYMETSAKTGDGVQAIFNDYVNELINDMKVKGKNEIISDDLGGHFDLNTQNEEVIVDIKKKGCCG